MNKIYILMLYLMCIDMCANNIEVFASNQVSVGTITIDNKGTVFCVYDTDKGETADQCRTSGSGNAGIIMSNEDLVNYDSLEHGISYSSSYFNIGKIAQSDNGSINTDAIIKSFPRDNDSNNAAYLCSKYGNQKDKWYLPSKEELYKMHLYADNNDLVGRNCSGASKGGAQCFIGGGGWGNDWDSEEQLKSYWSSSEYSELPFYDAWSHSFGIGIDGYDLKRDHYFAVRACRAFINE